jgi:hypothetical protein
MSWELKTGLKSEFDPHSDSECPENKNRRYAASSHKTNYEIVHDEIKNNKPTRASKDINTNSKINKDLRQLDDQAHKHNTEKPTHETPTRYQQQTSKPKDGR